MSKTGGGGNGGVDPSVQRLVDSCMKDLNGQFRCLEQTERAAVRKAMLAQRGRYCTFVACLKPVIDEEVGMFGELQQIEDVMLRLGRATANPNALPDACEQLIEDVSKAGDGDSVASLCLATPPSTPSPSSALGSRKSSMCSISSLASSASSVASTSTLTSPLNSESCPRPDSAMQASIVSHQIIPSLTNVLYSKP